VLCSLVTDTQKYGNLLRYIVQCLLHYHTSCTKMDHKFTTVKAKHTVTHKR